MDTIIAYTSGEAKGNPGPAATGVCIKGEEGQVIKEVTEFLGNGTTNFAEYYGVMLALQTLKQLYDDETKIMQFELCLCNELVKKQLNDELVINEPGLVPMFIEIHNMRVANFPNLSFKQISIAENKEADLLVKQALLHK